MIYFIQGAMGGPIKIGYTNNLGRRLFELQEGNPYPLRVLATTEGDRKVEGLLHRKFSEYRYRIEWFEDAPELLEFIANIDSFDVSTLYGPFDLLVERVLSKPKFAQIPFIRSHIRQAKLAGLDDRDTKKHVVDAISQAMPKLDFDDTDVQQVLRKLEMEYTIENLITEYNHSEGAVAS